MIGLVILFVMYGLLHMKPQSRHHLLRHKLDKAAAAIGLAFVFAAGPHFTDTDDLNWFAASHAVIYATGVISILAGFAMVPRRSRRIAGFVLLALVCAMLPPDTYFHERAWYLWVRIPIQIVFAAWLLWSTQRINEEE